MAPPPRPSCFRCERRPTLSLTPGARRISSRGVERSLARQNHRAGPNSNNRASDKTSPNMTASSSLEAVCSFSVNDYSAPLCSLFRGLLAVLSQFISFRNAGARTPCFPLVTVNARPSITPQKQNPPSKTTPQHPYKTMRSERKTHEQRRQNHAPKIWRSFTPTREPGQPIPVRWAQLVPQSCR